ncbi:EutP/PduV family microcompartment system protein [Paenibacillus sp. OAS669]|uniref:EutP/PduV family microcompartment system protein n=1 Tax=Paenibacillus sp. OAS669 TaxID=2663821 RepID=UPI001789B917|nr:EutP/PduV family microcompartment system protein [Paenibacillus sp. OAS669]MBE1445607.1 adenylate kinase family enzyme [Paenibacillus sp. OAS669]
MKKVLIIGIVASGKTTLAKRLSEKLKIPWYELDSIVHHRTEIGRYKRTADEQIEVIKDIDTYGEWIFEGTDRPSYRCLFEMADTIIFLDTPLWKRRIRILTRFLKQNLGIEKCNYKPDIEMLKMMYKWTRDFERSRDEFESRLRLYKEKVIRLNDNNDLNFASRLHHPTA